MNLLRGAILVLGLFAITYSAQAQMSPPVDLKLSLSDDSPSKGQQVTVTLKVTPRVNLYDTVVRFSSEKGVSLQGDEQITIGSLQKGETTEYSTSILLDGQGEGAVYGTAVASRERGGETFGDSRSRFFLIYPEKTYVSQAGYIAARVDSLEQASNDKLIKSKSYQDKLREIGTKELEKDTVKIKPKNKSQKDVEVEGKATWKDREGNLQGLRFTEVEIVDKNGNVLGSDVTDDSGNFLISTNESGPIDITIRVESEGDGFEVLMPGGGAGYTVEKEIVSVYGGINVVLSIGREPEWSVYASLVEISSFVENIEGSTVGKVGVRYPHNQKGNNGNILNSSFYTSDTEDGFVENFGELFIGEIEDPTIYIERADGFDWDVIHHEYGHHYSSEIGLDRNPGGPHALGDNLSEERVGCKSFPCNIQGRMFDPGFKLPDKNSGVRLAWGEAFPTFFAILAQRQRGLGKLGINSGNSLGYEAKVGDLRYTDTRSVSAGFSYKITSSSPTSTGEDNEVAVQRALWDIYDDDQESNDNISFSSSEIINIIKSSNPESFSDVVREIRSEVGGIGQKISNIGQVLEQQDIAPEPVRPMSGKQLPSDGGGTTFEWMSNGGGPNFQNNEFRVQFWTSDFSTLLYESDPITTSSQDQTATYTPPAGVFLNQIFANNSEAKWLVVGEQTDSPQTGPYVSSAQTISKTQACPALTASFTGLSSRLTSLPPTFPSVTASVDVQRNGNPESGLSSSDFSVVEDGSSELDFRFTKPSQGGSRLADIVFIVDNSGSMGPEQSDVQQNIRDFVDALAANNVDFALGLTRYGQGSRGGDPIIENNGVLISDATRFKNDILSRNQTSGAREPGYNAITKSASEFAFRSGSQRIFIILTDESPDQGSASASDALSALDGKGATLYASTRSFYNSDFQPLTDATGGKIFGITEDFSSVANSISSQVSSTYILSYRSPTTFFGGLGGGPRDVTVSVGGQDCIVSTSDSYMPGNVPLLSLTQSTQDKTNQAQPNDTGLDISIDASTFSGPDVEQATLFYRNSSSSSSYSSVKMQPSSGKSTTASASAKATPSSKANSTTYEATIPSSDVKSPGMDFYFTVTDGQSTVSLPSSDPQSNPLQTAVLPNKPPKITHNVPVSLEPGNALQISADVVDNTDNLSRVKLFYREGELITYTEVSMANASGDTYEASIPADAVTDSGVEYYIKATDNRGVSNTVGTADDPRTVRPAKCPETLQISDLSAEPDTDESVQISNSDQSEAVAVDGCSLTFFDGANSQSYFSANLSGLLPPGGTHLIGNPDVDGTDQTFAEGTLQDGPDAVAMYEAPASDFPDGTPAGENLDKRKSAVVYVSDDNIFDCFNASVSGCNSKSATSAGDPPLLRLDDLMNSVEEETPEEFALKQNSPNPFSGRTTIRYDLPEEATVELVVYDLLGRRVRSLQAGRQQAREHKVTLNAEGLSSGTYFLRLKAGDKVETQSIQIVR